MSGGVGHLILSGPLLFAVPVALAAGAVTFLSPCILPLVPGYLSYVTGMSGSTVAPVAPAAVAAPVAVAAGGAGAVMASTDGPITAVAGAGPAPGPARGRAVLGA